MTHRALLIGAQTGTLRGVTNDVVAMATALKARGFSDIRSLTGADATRDGILSAYENLIGDTLAGDPVVVFYSGHGARLRALAGAEAPWPSRMDIQFIVPADFVTPVTEDFRGITAAELSVLLARLTAITPNATVILDCCHSGLMSRDPSAQVKAIEPLDPDQERAAYGAVARHLKREQGRGLDLTLPHVVSNPSAVRIVACSPEQAAWELDNADGVRMGLLTDALTRVLAEVGDLPLSWSVIIQRVRERVHSRVLNQRPEAEGPSRRIPFGDVEAESATTLPVVDLGDGRIELHGAPLMGVRAGDEFVIEAPKPGGGVTTLGTAAVDHVSAMTAFAAVRLAAGRTAIPRYSRARRTTAVVPALPVGLAGCRSASGLLTALADSTLVRPAEPGDTPRIHICADAAGRLAVHDEDGPLHLPVVADPAGVRRIVENVHLMARAEALRTLEDHSFDHGVHVTWGRVSREGRRTEAERGVVHAGEHLWFEARNDGDRTVYVSLLDIGLSGRIGLLTGHLPGGMAMAPKTVRTIGFDDRAGRLVGVRLSWPETLPETDSRPETVLVIISEAPVDVSVLQQDGVRRAARALADGSPLERLLAQIATGRTRDLTATTTTDIHYVVQAIDFRVVPAMANRASRIDR